jgi:hypothetical protein
VEVDATLRNKGNSTLWIAGLVLGEVFEFVVLVLVVADIAVTVGEKVSTLEIIKLAS